LRLAGNRKAQLEELSALGVRRIIGWFNFEEMPWDAVRRSMDFTAELAFAPAPGTP
jgi:hypothetical protein